MNAATDELPHRRTSGSVDAPPCPVCNAPCHEPPFREFTVEQSAALFCPISRSRDRYERFLRCIRRLWNGDTCRMYHCSACGFGFGWPFVGGDQEFYSLMHEMAGYSAQRWEFGLTIQRVLSNASPGRILDIGTGTGLFLEQVPQAWEKWAIETGEELAGLLRSKGFNVAASTQELEARLAGRFDVITMFQVIEHVAEFRPLLKDCCMLLKPGGTLVISTPHKRHTTRQEDVTGCADMPPNHINRWTERSLGMALEQCGFTVDEHIVEPSHVKNAAYCATLKVRASASNNPRSLAGRAFGLQRRWIRYPALALLSGAALLSILPQLAFILRGQSFVTIARRTG